jgi:hypothetical protein
MNNPKLTSFAAPEGRVSSFGRPGGTDMNNPKLTSFAAPEGRVSSFGRPGGTDMNLLRQLTVAALGWLCAAAFAACPFGERPTDAARSVSLLSRLAMESCLGDAQADTDPLTATVHQAVGKAGVLETATGVTGAIAALGSFAREQSSAGVQAAEWHALATDLGATAGRAASLADATTSSELLAAGDRAIESKWSVYTDDPSRPLVVSGVALQPVSSVACPASGNCPAFESRVRMLRVINLMTVLQRQVQRPAFKEQLAQARVELARWNSYRTQSQHQYVWELFVNSRMMARDKRICPRADDGALQGFCSVPSSQWIVMHPDAGLRWSSRAGQSAQLKPAFVVEMIGRSSFEWRGERSAEIASSRGWSLAAAYSQSGARHQWSFGPMLHYNGYNLALTKGPGDRWGLMLNLQLADSYFKLVDHVKERKDDWTLQLRAAGQASLRELATGR